MQGRPDGHIHRLREKPILCITKLLAPNLHAHDQRWASEMWRAYLGSNDGAGEHNEHRYKSGFIVGLDKEGIYGTNTTIRVAALYAFVNPLYLRCSLWPNFCGYSSVWTLRARLANFSSVRRQRTLTATQTERSNSKDTGLRYAVRPH